MKSPVALLYDYVTSQFATIKAPSTAPVAADPALVVVISPNQQAIPVTGGGTPTLEASFVAFQNAVAVAPDKSLFSLVNASGSAVVVRLYRIWMRNSQTGSLVGIIANFRLHRITGHSAGTLVNTFAYDLSDTLNASVSVRTGATVTGQDNALYLNQWKWSTDEYGGGATDVESADHALQNLIPAWEANARMKPLVLRAGQGAHIWVNTEALRGSFDFMFEFTQAAS